jgi:hypothetical protein
MENISFNREIKLPDVMKAINPDRVVEYVHSLECPSGGFCFYGLDEPNLADTFFATYTLSLLSRAPIASERTIAFVRRFFQLPLGEGALWGIYYGLRVLRLFDQDLPRLSHVEQIVLQFFNKRVSASTGPFEMMSLELLSHVVELMELFKFPLERRSRKAGQDYILQFQNQDGGFGIRNSSLEETSFAVRILKGLHYPIDILPVREFALRCEQEDVGFTIVPGSTSAFLEDIYFGLLAFSALGLKARYETPIARFIFECQTGTNGFRRSRLLGIPTLEYTYMAIKSFDIIGAMARGGHNGKTG